MAQVSNPATMSSVKSVFGGTNNLSAYLKGSSYVYDLPSSYPSLASVLPIRLSQLAGLIHPPASLPSTMNGSQTKMAPLDAYVWVTINADGTFTYGSGAGTSGTWKLVPGNANEFDVVMWTVSGDAFSGSSMNSWLSLGTNQTWFYSITGASGIKSGAGTLQIREHYSSQRIMATASVSMYAEVEANPCPLCCFTPDTLVLMATGDWMAIVEVQVGDEIASRSGSKKVTEVITRTNRVMYEIQFADGRILNASEDHPLYVADKGYAAINPGVGGEYKDLGIPDQLYVGDRVLDSDGRENEIVSIMNLDYPHTVYTLAESEFYANGMLVY